MVRTPFSFGRCSANKVSHPGDGGPSDAEASQEALQSEDSLLQAPGRGDERWGGSPKAAEESTAASRAALKEEVWAVAAY